MLIKYSTLTTTLLIIIGETLASLFNLYETVPTYDVYMHILGGMWVASFLMFFFSRYKYNICASPSHMQNGIVLISLVMMIGILWEFYEFGAYTLAQTVLPADIYTDTLFDLFFDFCGATIITLFFTKSHNKNLTPA